MFIKNKKLTWTVLSVVFAFAIFMVAGLGQHALADYCTCNPLCGGYYDVSACQGAATLDGIVTATPVPSSDGSGAATLTCPAGDSLTNGQCIPNTAPSTSLLGTECPSGMVNVGGTCESAQAAGASGCGPGYIWTTYTNPTTGVTSSGACSPVGSSGPMATTGPSAGSCGSSALYTLNTATGQCVSLNPSFPSTTACSGGAVPQGTAASFNCTCPSGTSWNGGACVATSNLIGSGVCTPSCSGGTTCIAYGSSPASCVSIGSQTALLADSLIKCTSNTQCGGATSCVGATASTPGSCQSTEPAGLSANCASLGEIAISEGTGWVCGIDYSNAPKCGAGGTCTDPGNSCNSGVCLPTGCTAQDEYSLDNFACQPQMHSAYLIGTQSVLNTSTDQCVNNFTGVAPCEWTIDCKGNPVLSPPPAGQSACSQTIQSHPVDISDPYANTLTYYNCVSATGQAITTEAGLSTLGVVCTPNSSIAASNPAFYGIGVSTTTPASSRGGGGTTTTGGGTTATIPSGVVASVVGSPLASAFAGWTSVLQGVATGLGTTGGTGTGSTAGTGSGSTAASGATGSGTGTGTGGGSTGASGSCTTTAAATISSSLQTLQGLASVLSSTTVSPGILSSIQNLINSVAQVLSALAGCISGQ